MLQSNALMLHLTMKCVYLLPNVPNMYESSVCLVFSFDKFIAVYSLQVREDCKLYECSSVILQHTPHISIAIGTQKD